MSINATPKSDAPKPAFNLTDSSTNLKALKTAVSYSALLKESMIEALPKKDDRVFPIPYANMLRRFVTMRKRTADIHQNPRLLAVDFTAFRTWAGTMIAYHTNGNVLTVKKLLGHKQIKNTLKYIGRIEFKDRDFETTSATTIEDVLRLGKEGWVEYSVVKINNVEYHCFKKPKRFSSYVQNT